MRKRIWLPLGLALIMAITVAGSPVKVLACGPAIAAGAALAPAIGSGVVGVISTIGNALGLVKTAQDTFAPAGNAAPPQPTYPPEHYGYSSVPGYVAPGYPTPNQGSPGYGYLEPNGRPPY